MVQAPPVKSQHKFLGIFVHKSATGLAREFSVSQLSAGNSHPETPQEKRILTPSTEDLLGHQEDWSLHPKTPQG